MKAMILAAGEGTRLRPLTYAIPKPMAPVANVPLLLRTILQLRDRAGITEIAVNLFHRPDAIRDALGDGSRYGVALHYSEETTLLGTAGGVKRMDTFLDQTFLLLYGDNLYDADFGALCERHRAFGGAATIATFQTPNPTACGLVLSDSSGRITRFQEKPPAEDVFTNTANAGVYVLEPAVVRAIPPETICDFGKDIFPALLQSGDLSLYATPLNGYLQDTGTPDGYRKANWDLLQGNTSAAAHSLAADGILRGAETTIHPTARLTGRIILGDGCTIGADAELHDAILWQRVSVGAGARVANCVVADDATIRDGTFVEDALIAA